MLELPTCPCWARSLVAQEQVCQAGSEDRVHIKGVMQPHASLKRS